MFPIYSKIFKLPTDLVSIRFLHNPEQDYQNNSYINIKLQNKFRVVSKKTQLDNDLSQISNRKEKDTLVSRNLWQKLINQYWQETVYLSINNANSELYTNKLTLNNLSLYKTNEYKSFLNKFIKYLLTNNSTIQWNHIRNHNNLYMSNNQSTYFKYIWKKKLYLCCSYLNLINKNSNTISKNLIKKIDIFLYNSLPLFSIINNSNHVIMAESSNKIVASNNTVISSQSSRLKYTGLFFINSGDALEYKYYIDKNYQNSSRNKFTKVSINSLVNYYKLLYSSSNNIDLRLIPDLNEVSQLIYKYQYYNNVILNNEQEYGKNFFRGQPVYMIQPIKSNHKYLKEKKYISYDYPIPDIRSSNRVKYKTLFLNYETTVLAWKRFREKNIDYHLPSKPIVLVSNLETEIHENLYKEQLQTYKQKILQDKILIVPSLDTYSFIKNDLIDKFNPVVQSQFNDNLLYMTNLIKRIVWSLTTRQPSSL